MSTQSPMTVPFPFPTAQRQPPAATSGFLHALTSNPIATTIQDAYNAFHTRREALGLSNPGPFQALGQQASHILAEREGSAGLQGLQATLVKRSGMGFETHHTFASGTPQYLPPYAFQAMLSLEKTLLQAGWSTGTSAGSSAVIRHAFSKRLATTVNMMIPNPGGPAGDEAQIQVSNDYDGDDFSARVEGSQMSVEAEGLMGTFQTQYLQSVTPKLALGIEAQALRQPGQSMCMLAYVGQYRGSDWTAHVATTPFSSLKATYSRSLAPHCDGAVALDIAPSQDMATYGRTSAVGSFGLMYKFPMSLLRAKIDTAGKLTALLEGVIMDAPMLTVRSTIHAQLDHAKNTSTAGLSFSFESQTSDVAEIQQMQMQQAHAQGQMPGQPYA